MLPNAIKYPGVISQKKPKPGAAMRMTQRPLLCISIICRETAAWGLLPRSVIWKTSSDDFTNHQISRTSISTFSTRVGNRFIHPGYPDSQTHFLTFCWKYFTYTKLTNRRYTRTTSWKPYGHWSFGWRLSDHRFPVEVGRTRGTSEHFPATSATTQLMTMAPLNVIESPRLTWRRKQLPALLLTPALTPIAMPALLSKQLHNWYKLQTSTLALNSLYMGEVSRSCTFWSPNFLLL